MLDSWDPVRGFREPGEFARSHSVLVLIFLGLNDSWICLCIAGILNWEPQIKADCCILCLYYTLHDAIVLVVYYSTPCRSWCRICCLRHIFPVGPGGADQARLTGLGETTAQLSPRAYRPSGLVGFLQSWSGPTHHTPRGSIPYLAAGRTPSFFAPGFMQIATLWPNWLFFGPIESKWPGTELLIDSANPCTWI